MKRPLLWILAGAFAVRAAYLWLSQASPYFGPEILDARYYHEWALRILEGRGWGEGVFYGLPLYPFFLALAYKLSQSSVLFVKILQSPLLGTLTVFLIYKIARFLSGEKCALAAAAFAAIYGPLFFHENIFVPEAIGLPLYAGALYAALLFAEKPGVKKGVLFGALAGLATLTKAGVLLFAIIFLIWKAFRSFKPAAVSLVVFILILAPVTLHNWIYGKDFVLLTSHGGFNFYIGNNAQAEGVFKAPEGTGSNVEAQIHDSRAVAEREEGRALKPSEVSRYWSKKAWAFIKENPAQAARLWAKKLALFFDAREISDVDDYKFGARFNPFLKFPWPDFAVLGPLFLLGFLGCLAALKQKETVALWTASYLFGIVGFFINARYRLPLLSVMIPVAAAGAFSLFYAFRDKKWMRAALYCAVLAGAVVLTQLKLVGTDWLRDYTNTADIYFKTGQMAEAEAYFEEALKRDPDSPRANLGLGVLYSKMGRQEEARRYYEAALKSQPNEEKALTNLGYYYIGKGDLETAEGYLLKAIAAKPDAYQAYTNLGLIYGRRGRDEKAIEAFKHSLSIKPDNPRVLTNLGMMMAKQGDRHAAREYWEKALTIDPGFNDARRGLAALDAS
jgi:Flp pilus assembly protein TadD